MSNSPIRVLLGLCILVFTGCTEIPANVQPVTQFEVMRYLGQWYEIARLDHSFERGLTDVRAHYSLREDGGLKVINQGYSPQKKAWKTAEGRAYFAKDPSQGFLKVSFFRPFYGSYIVFELDHKNYQYALVSGPNKSYLWLLSRTPTMDLNTQRELIAKAESLGFDTSRLIVVDQSHAGFVGPDLPGNGNLHGALGMKKRRIAATLPLGDCHYQ